VVQVLLFRIRLSRCQCEKTTFADNARSTGNFVVRATKPPRLVPEPLEPTCRNELTVGRAEALVALGALDCRQRGRVIFAAEVAMVGMAQLFSVRSPIIGTCGTHHRLSLDKAAVSVKVCSDASWIPF